MRVDWREMRAVVAAFAANLGIAVIKFVAFLLTGSASMLAESVHSVADTGNQVLLFVGRRPVHPAGADEHPFGFGRERYFYGFVVSVMLFTVGAAFSVYDGIHKIINPEEIRSPQIAFIVLALSAVLEGFSLRTAIGEANKVRGDRNWVHLHPADQGAGAAGRPARGPGRPVRADVRVRRGGAVRADRQRPLGRRRLAGHRPAARDGRRHPGRGDEEPADRRVGQPRDAADDRGRARGRPGASPRSFTCGPCT